MEIISVKGECAAHDDLLAVPNMRHAFILIDAISILFGWSVEFVWRQICYIFIWFDILLIVIWSKWAVSNAFLYLKTYLLLFGPSQIGSFINFLKFWSVPFCIWIMSSDLKHESRVLGCYDIHISIQPSVFYIFPWPYTQHYWRYLTITTTIVISAKVEAFVCFGIT